MRRTLTVLAVVALAAGCSAPQRVTGEAMPAGGATPARPVSPVSPVPSAVPTSPAASSPGVARSSSAPATSPSPSPSRSSASPAGTAANQLTPVGLGELRLGMSLKQALATGLVKNQQGDDICGTLDLVPSGTRKRLVKYSGKMGIVTIPAYGSVATPEGIRIGDSLAKARAAYPRMVIEDEPGGYEDVNTDPGDGTNTHFDITFEDGRVTSIVVEIDNADC